MKVGLIAGGGDLPKHICTISKIDAIVAFNNTSHPDLNLCGCPILWTTLGQVKAIISFFKSLHITHIMMIGDIKRPSLAQLKVDYLGAKWLIRLGSSFLKGDDGLLQAIANMIEEEGFTMTPTPSMTTESFNLDLIDPITKQDIEHGHMVLKTLSPFDIGQSIVVEHGIVLGIEAAEGTDHLIQRCKNLKKIKSAGVLIKRHKTNQHNFLDTPTIGPTTIDIARDCGLMGISIDSKTNVIHPSEVQNKIKVYHMFLDIFSN